MSGTQKDYQIKTQLQKAENALNKLKLYQTHQVNHAVNTLLQALEDKIELYAEQSVAETGYGNYQDNILKYRNCLSGIKKYAVSDYVDKVYNKEKRIIQFPKPAGIIVSLVPGTNPIMTIYYVSLISIMTRNAIIFSPHPSVKHCAVHLVDFIRSMTEACKMPEDAIQIIRDPDIDSLNSLMQSPEVNLILATGGKNRVKAAYQSGNPTFGMGPANVPCFVHRSADITRAAQQIVESNSFDHALPCVCESVIIADTDISSELKAALYTAGGYIVNKQEEKKLRNFLFPDNKLNTDAIGRSAARIAQQAGLSIRSDVKSLIVEIHMIGSDEPISQEKLFPVIGYISSKNMQNTIHAACAMLDMAGRGHSAVIHSYDQAIVTQYAQALPVCRITVNNQAVAGSGGVTTGLTRSPLIGTGFFGGSIVDDNIGPQHLIQWSRIAYPI